MICTKVIKAVNGIPTGDDPICIDSDHNSPTFGKQVDCAECTECEPTPLVSQDIEYVCNEDTNVYDICVTVVTDGVITSNDCTPTEIPCDEDPDFEKVRVCLNGTIHIQVCQFDEDGTKTVLEEVDTGETCGQDLQLIRECRDGFINIVTYDLASGVKVEIETSVTEEICLSEIITVDVEYKCNVDTNVYDKCTTTVTNGVPGDPVVEPTTIPCDAKAPDVEKIRVCNSDTLTYHIEICSFDEDGVKTILEDIDTGETCGQDLQLIRECRDGFINVVTYDLSSGVKVEVETSITEEVCVSEIITVDLEYKCNSDTNLYDKCTTTITDGIPGDPVVEPTDIPCDPNNPVDVEKIKICDPDTLTYHIQICSFDEDGVKTILEEIDTLESCEEPKVATILECKSKQYFTGIENTGTRYNFEWTVDLVLNNGMIVPVVLPSASGWGPQMVGWTSAINDALIAAGVPVCEVARYWHEWRANANPVTSIPNDLDVCFNFEAARGQYVHIAVCAQDAEFQIIDAIVTATTTTSSNHLQVGDHLLLAVGEGKEEYNTYCIECDVEPEKPKCCIPVSADFPPLPEPVCTYQVVPGCDDLDTDDVADDVQITATYQICDGVISVSYFTEDSDGNLESYDLVGSFKPFCEDCEVLETFNQCDLGTCEQVTFVKKVCNGTIIIEGPFLLNTDIDSDAKGPFAECTPKNIVSTDCVEVPEYHLTWDNGVARCPWDLTPLPGAGGDAAGSCGDYINKFNTPWGEVLAPTNGGFIDRRLGCGSGTLDEIIVDGVNIVQSPITIPTSPGSRWVPLNNLLWDTISTATGIPITAGIGCDNGRPTGTLNCYGRGITCENIFATSFKVTDCNGTNWEFSIVNTYLGVTKYDRVFYEDCKGNFQCEYVDQCTKEIVPLDKDCVVPCGTNSGELDSECTESFTVVCTKPLEYTGTLSGYRWNTEGNAINGNPGGFENEDISDVWTATDSFGLPNHPNPFDDQFSLSPPSIFMTESAVITGEDADNYIIEGYVIVPSSVNSVILQGYGGAYGWEAFYAGATPDTATLIGQGIQFSAQNLEVPFDISGIEPACDDTKCFWFRHYSDDSNGAAFIHTRISLDGGATFKYFDQADVKVSEVKPEPITVETVVTLPCGEVPVLDDCCELKEDGDAVLDKLCDLITDLPCSTATGEPIAYECENDPDYFSGSQSTGDWAGTYLTDGTADPVILEMVFATQALYDLRKDWIATIEECGGTWYVIQQVGETTLYWGKQWLSFVYDDATLTQTVTYHQFPQSEIPPALQECYDDLGIDFQGSMDFWRGLVANANEGDPIQSQDSTFTVGCISETPIYGPGEGAEKGLSVTDKCLTEAVNELTDKVCSISELIESVKTDCGTNLEGANYECATPITTGRPNNTVPWELIDNRDPDNQVIVASGATFQEFTDNLESLGYSQFIVGEIHYICPCPPGLEQAGDYFTTADGDTVTKNPFTDISTLEGAPDKVTSDDGGVLGVKECNSTDILSTLEDIREKLCEPTCTYDVWCDESSIPFLVKLCDDDSQTITSLDGSEFECEVKSVICGNLTEGYIGDSVTRHNIGGVWTDVPATWDTMSESDRISYIETAVGATPISGSIPGQVCYDSDDNPTVITGYCAERFCALTAWSKRLTEVCTGPDGEVSPLNCDPESPDFDVTSKNFCSSILGTIDEVTVYADGVPSIVYYIDSDGNVVTDLGDLTPGECQECCPVPIEVCIKYPNTEGGCLNAFQYEDPCTGIVKRISLADGTNVQDVLDECGIELEYIDCNCDCNSVIVDPGCPTLNFGDGPVFTNDVRDTSDPDNPVILWNAGDSITFPHQAGPNYLSDFTHCFRMEQSCCLLNLDPTLPLTVRFQVDHEIEVFNGSHSGFNVNPGAGTIVASSPTNTSTATIGGDEGIRAVRWIDIEYTLGDLLEGVCLSTGALGTSNTTDPNDPFGPEAHEDIYSYSLNLSPDFITQLTDILNGCPCE